MYIKASLVKAGSFFNNKQNNIGSVLCSPESDLANLGQLYRDERLKQKAESMRLDHCDKLHRLVSRQRGK